MAKIKQLKFFDQTSYFKTTKEEINTLLTDRLLKRIIQLIFILLGLNFFFLGLWWSKLPPQLPLFYSRPWGEEQLVAKNLFFILPAACFIFIIINLRLASFFFKKEVLLSQILIWSALVFSLLTTISLWKILTIAVF